MSNYVSPYGFDPATDALLDVVAERQGITADEIADKLHENNDRLYDEIDLYFWDQHGGPAVDYLEDLLYPQVES